MTYINTHRKKKRKIVDDEMTNYSSDCLDIECYSFLSFDWADINEDCRLPWVREKRTRATDA